RYNSAADQRVPTEAKQIPDEQQAFCERIGGAAAINVKARSDLGDVRSDHPRIAPRTATPDRPCDQGIASESEPGVEHGVHDGLFALRAENQRERKPLREAPAER
ncbi:MAG: hypothetical protein WBM40_19555, partial [Thiohalocapsa sp.]